MEGSRSTMPASPSTRPTSSPLAPGPPADSASPSAAADRCLPLATEAVVHLRHGRQVAADLCLVMEPYMPSENSSAEIQLADSARLQSGSDHRQTPRLIGPQTDSETD